MHASTFNASTMSASHSDFNLTTQHSSHPTFRTQHTTPHRSHQLVGCYPLAKRPENCKVHSTATKTTCNTHAVPPSLSAVRRFPLAGFPLRPRARIKAAGTDGRAAPHRTVPRRASYSTASRLSRPEGPAAGRTLATASVASPPASNTAAAPMPLPMHMDTTP
jgi:hypothetical protein